jgi:hypothetical protein
MAVAAGRLGIPGKLSIPFDLLFAPTATSSFTLIIHRLSNGDMLLGLLGLCGCVGWLGLWGWCQFRLNAKPVIEPSEEDDAEKEQRKTATGIVFAAFLVLKPIRILQKEDCAWAARRASREHDFNSGIARFEDYAPSRQWFIWIELATAVALSYLQAMTQPPSGADEDIAWRTVHMANVTVCGVVLVSCFAMAHNERMARINYFLTAVTSLGSALCGLLDDPSSALIVALAQVYLSMLVTFVDLAGRLSGGIVKAAQLSVSLWALLLLRFKGSAEKAQRPAAVEQLEREEKWRQSQPVRTLERLMNKGLILPKPLLSGAQICVNLSLLVREAANRRARQAARQVHAEAQ